MIPDKIFIDEDLIAFHVLQTKHEGDVEYICKDALLEWVRLAYGKLSMNPFDIQDVFEELIDKIK